MGREGKREMEEMGKEREWKSVGRASLESARDLGQGSSWESMGLP